MAEAELVSELVVGMLDGVQAKKEKLGKFYKKFDEEFPDRVTVKKKFRSIIDLISQIFEGDLPASVFSGRVLFYSLFLSVFDVVYGMPNSPISKPPRKISRDSFPAIKQALKVISRKLNDEDSSLSEFVDASTRHTNDKRERTIRHKFLCERLRAAL